MAWHTVLKLGKVFIFKISFMFPFVLFFICIFLLSTFVFVHRRLYLLISRYSSFFSEGCVHCKDRLGACKQNSEFQPMTAIRNTSCRLSSGLAFIPSAFRSQITRLWMNSQSKEKKKVASSSRSPRDPKRGLLSPLKAIVLQNERNARVDQYQSQHATIFSSSFFSQGLKNASRPALNSELWGRKERPW